MIFYGLNHADSLAFPAIFLLCRFGTGGLVVIMVAANPIVFYVENAAMAFGIGSFFARALSSAVPIVAILD